MGLLIKEIVTITLQVLAGVGLGHFADKIAADKLPSYPEGGVSPTSSGMPKIIYTVIISVLGILIWKFISRKLKIKL